MQSIFADAALSSEEILPIVAFLADKAEEIPESTQPATLMFVLFGLSGTVVALLLFDVVWRRRLQGVRKPFIQQVTSQGKG